MKFIYSINFWWILILFISCDNSAKSKGNVIKNAGNSTRSTDGINDTAFENYVIDTIFSLKEIQNENRQLDPITNHQKGVSMMINKSPESKGEYEISVGYNGEKRFETYHIFYFDSITKQITVMDAVSGDKISLADWRKKKS